MPILGSEVGTGLGDALVLSVTGPSDGGTVPVGFTVTGTVSYNGSPVQATITIQTLTGSQFPLLLPFRLGAALGTIGTGTAAANGTWGISTSTSVPVGSLTVLVTATYTVNGQTSTSATISRAVSVIGGDVLSFYGGSAVAADTVYTECDTTIGSGDSSFSTTDIYYPYGNINTTDTAYVLGSGVVTVTAVARNIETWAQPATPQDAVASTARFVSATPIVSAGAVIAADTLTSYGVSTFVDTALATGASATVADATINAADTQPVIGASTATVDTVVFSNTDVAVVGADALVASDLYTPYGSVVYGDTASTVGASTTMMVGSLTETSAAEVIRGSLMSAADLLTGYTPIRFFDSVVLVGASWGDTDTAVERAEDAIISSPLPFFQIDALFDALTLDENWTAVGADSVLVDDVFAGAAPLVEGAQFTGTFVIDDLNVAEFVTDVAGTAHPGLYVTDSYAQYDGTPVLSEAAMVGHLSALADPTASWYSSVLGAGALKLTSKVVDSVTTLAGSLVKKALVNKLPDLTVYFDMRACNVSNLLPRRTIYRSDSNVIPYRLLLANGKYLHFSGYTAVMNVKIRLDDAEPVYTIPGTVREDDDTWIYISISKGEIATPLVYSACIEVDNAATGDHKSRSFTLEVLDHA